MSSQLTLSSMASRRQRSQSLGSPELPPLRRTSYSSQSQSQSNTQPTLPKTMAYVFTHGLFKRTLLDTDPPSVQYSCLQPSCNYSTKSIGTKLQSTGNLNQHYTVHHKGVPKSLIEERQLKKPQQPETSDFFRKYSSRTGDNIQRLILNVIVSNNLPLSLVESPSF
jgi:hypothetical protein